MSEQKTRKDLEKKIFEIIQEDTDMSEGAFEKLDESKKTEETSEVEEKTSDQEWYHGTLYESLVKKWAK